MKVIGNKQSLLSLYGSVNADKLLEAIEYMTNISELNIDALNKESEKGGLYVSENGKILKDFDKASEYCAKYLIIPTGLKLKYTEYPLFASFIKINSFWEGAFIGTGTQLFEMYKKHTKNMNKFCTEYKDIFSGDNRYTDLNGFGLSEVLKNKKDIVEVAYTDIDNKLEDTKSSLALAIEKAQTKANSKGMSKSSANKAKKKALRLQAHLNKVKEKEERINKLKLEQEEKEQEEYKNDEVIEWVEYKPLEESTTHFEDEATKLFNKKINEFINGDDKYSKYEETLIQESSIKEKLNTEYTEDDNEKLALEDMDHDIDSQEKYDRISIRMQLQQDLIGDIYERLLIKERWLSNNKNKIGFYLKGLCLFIWQERQTMNTNELHGNGFTFSEDKSKCVINTGLLDTYGNYIYLIDHTPHIADFYSKSVSIMYNKSLLLNYKFNLLDIRKLPEPSEIIKDKSKLIFDANIDDFDLDDDLHLKHIIAERKHRFPVKYQKESDLALSNKIKDAIVQAIKISKSDYRYIIPKYDFTRKDIQFLIPFFLDKSLDESPELTIVVGKQQGIWCIYTVLDTEDAYDDARLICRPSNNWISNF